MNVWPADAIERAILERDIRIVDLHFNKGLDLLLVVLNTRDVLRVPISGYPSLKKASEAQREDWRLIGNGYGVQWPKIDEHLSLKGFLRDALMSEFLHQFGTGKPAKGVRKAMRLRA